MVSMWVWIWRLQSPFAVCSYIKNDLTDRTQSQCFIKGSAAEMQQCISPAPSFLYPMKWFPLRGISLRANDLLPLPRPYRFHVTWELFSDTAQMLSDVIKIGLWLEKPPLIGIKAARDAHVHEVSSTFACVWIPHGNMNPLNPRPSVITVITIMPASQEDEELRVCFFECLQGCN